MRRRGRPPALRRFRSGRRSGVGAPPPKRLRPGRKLRNESPQARRKAPRRALWRPGPPRSSPRTASGWSTLKAGLFHSPATQEPALHAPRRVAHSHRLRWRIRSGGRGSRIISGSRSTALSKRAGPRAASGFRGPDCSRAGRHGSDLPGARRGGRPPPLQAVRCRSTDKWPVAQRIRSRRHQRRRRDRFRARTAEAWRRSAEDLPWRWPRQLEPVQGHRAFGADRLRRHQGRRFQRRWQAGPGDRESPARHLGFRRRWEREVHLLGQGTGLRRSAGGV